jgi:Big-like domain-containing protein
MKRTRVSMYGCAVPVVCVVVVGLSASTQAGFGQNGQGAGGQQGSPASPVDYPVQLTVPPSGVLPPQAHPPGPPRVIPLYRPPFRAGAGNIADPVLQTSAPTPAAAQALGQWEGLGEGYPGFTVTAVPPDPNLAVGPNHIVQWVNNALVVFDKQGNQVQAPVADSTFWGALSTCYQGGGFSDPIVEYDRAADRWVVGEVAIPLFPGLFGQYAQCFAVSKTSDPTFTSDANGNNTSYYLWAYGFGSNVNDYDKIAVWADGYYVTWNIFQNGTTFIGAEACAWDRNQMLSGVATPTFKCFQLSSAYASLLPADLDGATAPPAGSPDFFMDIDPSSGALNLWKFHVDFANLSNSTFTGPTSIAGVAPFTAPCFTPPDTISQDCIPQPATTQMLDALGDRLMYRLAYRNLGDHESLVANHTVLTAGGNTGVRWYEVRSPNGTPSLYQQGTFAPDTTDNRWMASIAMDKSGNIGVGYSVSNGATTYPSIRYTGREVGDPIGTLQAETTLVAGGGSQTGYNRWGDYSAMKIDPSDDCTLWYTQEYQATTQSANWNTRIGSFKFSSCGQALTATTTTLGSSPNPSTYGQSVTFTATVTAASGTPAGNVTFKDGGTTLGSSVLNVSDVAIFSTSALAGGSHSITAVYGGSASYSGSTSPTLTQNVSPTGTTTTLTSSPNPSNSGQTVTFTATVSPATATGSVQFLDGATSLGTQNLSGGSATLSTSTLTVGGHSIKATYSGDGNYSGSSSNTVSQTVNAPVGDFSIAATPSTRTISRGASTTYTVTVAPLNSFTGTVSFGVSGLPGRSTASFNPTSVTTSGSSTLTVQTSSRTIKGTYTLKITGTSGALAHSVNVTLKVQ